jgi:hypothetical protein
VCGLFKWICAGFISFVYKCVAIEDPIVKKGLAGLILISLLQIQLRPTKIDVTDRA